MIKCDFFSDKQRLRATVYRIILAVRLIRLNFRSSTPYCTRCYATSQVSEFLKIARQQPAAASGWAFSSSAITVKHSGFKIAGVKHKKRCCTLAVRRYIESDNNKWEQEVHKNDMKHQHNVAVAFCIIPTPSLYSFYNKLELLVDVLPTIIHAIVCGCLRSA